MRMISSFIVPYLGSEARNRFLGDLPDTAPIRLSGLPVRNEPNGIPRPPAIIGTNPGDLRITSALPVILSELHETMFANLLQSLLRFSIKVIARRCGSATSKETTQPVVPV